VRSPEGYPYQEGEKLFRRTDREDRHKQHFDEDGQVIDSSDDSFEQPSKENAQGKVLSI
jgi:hypothetical protein